MNPQTLQEYDTVVTHCRQLFEKKTHDYGTSWRVLRLPSLTDQIYIKARRIRTLQTKGIKKIEEDQQTEFIGIINYALMALIQLSLGATTEADLTAQQATQHYDQQVTKTLDLLRNKNHDYDEAWREMRVESMTDIILMKLLRIKQIEDNAGQTLASEGVEGGYRDMVNYSVFCLIQLGFVSGQLNK